MLKSLRASLAWQQKRSHIKSDNADLIGSETELRQGSGPCGVLLSDMGDSLEVSAPVGVAVDGHGP